MVPTVYIQLLFPKYGNYVLKCGIVGLQLFWYDRNDI